MSDWSERELEREPREMDISARSWWLGRRFIVAVSAFILIVLALLLYWYLTREPRNFIPPTSDGQCNDPFNPASVDPTTWNAYAPVACAPSTSPLFADAGPNDVFEFELQADFDIINDLSITAANAYQAQSPGTLRYTDPATGQPVEIAITLEARGKSRFTYCAFRPLKIVFPVKQIGNIFEGASRKLKVVTHCGNHPTNPWILGGTPEEQRRCLMAEYYFYQVLETLGSTALSTRLALITYRDDDGTEIITEYAFLREREDDTCARCDYVDEFNAEGDLNTLTPDATSVFQAELYNKFVYNNDYVITSGHNTRICYDSSLNAYYIPYDWDLTGVIRPEYFKNGNVDYRDNAVALWDWLESQNPLVRTQVQVWHIVEHEDDMRDVLRNTLLDAEGEALMQGWYELYMCVLKCFLGIQTPNCSQRGSHSLFVASFNSDTIGSMPAPSTSLHYGPPGASLDMQGTATTIKVVDSAVLGSLAMKLTRGGVDPVIANALVGDIGEGPYTSGSVYLEYRAHGKVISEPLIAGMSISVRSVEGEVALALKLYDGSYHLREGKVYVPLAGSYNPATEHFVHIEVNLDTRRYSICIDDEVLAENKTFLSNSVENVHTLKFFVPPAITEAFPTEYVVDDIRITK